ncbi:MAG: restriction endonuclease subunit S [[Ruminococcus] torques]
MVNIIPAGVPFYPTDHCGVLRIKTEKILPEYMMYALQAEGEYERFSRNNRASAQRIRSLVVQAPETKIQKNIIDELKALDDKINGQNAEIEKYENSIRTKFDQIFHLEEFISDGVFSKYEGYSVEDLCIDGRGRVINQQYIENHSHIRYILLRQQTTVYSDLLIRLILTESILRGRLTARKQELFFTETENSTVQMYVEH